MYRSIVNALLFGSILGPADFGKLSIDKPEQLKDDKDLKQEPNSKTSRANVPAKVELESSMP